MRRGHTILVRINHRRHGIQHKHMPSGKQDITAEKSGDTITGVWNIASDFTAESGFYEVQLRITQGENVWLSDKMLLIVSESTDGSVQAGDSQAVGYVGIRREPVMDTDIIFSYEG